MNNYKIVQNGTSGSISIQDLKKDVKGVGYMPYYIAAGATVDLSAEFEREETQSCAGLDLAVANGSLTVIDTYPEATEQAYEEAIATLAGSKVSKAGDVMTDTLVLRKDNAASLRLSGPDFGAVVRQSYAGVYYNDQYNSPGVGILKTRVIQGGNEFMDMEIQSSHAVLISAQDIAFHDGFVKLGANKYIDFHAQADGDTVAKQQLRVTRKDEATFGDANTSAVELKSVCAPGETAAPLEINTTDNTGLKVGGPVTLTTVQVLTGAGVPAVVAPDGSIFLRTDGGAGTTFYVRESGAWVGK